MKIQSILQHNVSKNPKHYNTKDYPATETTIVRISTYLRISTYKSNLTYGNLLKLLIYKSINCYFTKLETRHYYYHYLQEEADLPFIPACVLVYVLGSFDILRWRISPR